MIKVSVCIITYNHEKFIATAIDSVICQSTNFEYELVIGDDCSTDKTRDILVEYLKRHPEKIRLFLRKENIGAMQNFINTIKACKGEYIAMLEGDDYWTDRYKLHKQVDFLEKNSDYGLVHSDYDIFYQDNTRRCTSVNKSNDKSISVGNVYNELLIRNFICTPTVLFRGSFIRDSNFFNSLIIHNWLLGDWPMWLEISAKSKVGYIDTSMATYRMHQGSITNHSSKLARFEFIKSMYSMRMYFISKYGYAGKTKDEFDLDYHRVILHNCYYTRERELARSSYHFLKSKGFGYNLITIFEYLGLVVPVLWLTARICARIMIFLRKQLL